MPMRCCNIFVFLVLYVLGLSAAGGSGGTGTEWPLPPTFVQPCTSTEIKPIYYTRPWDDHVVVTWKKPNAVDRNGNDNLLRIEQVVGHVSGSRFPGTIFGQTHMIAYQATDKDGLRGSCSFTFTVIIPSCPALKRSRNGYMACTKNTMYGSKCTLKCYEGFRSTGNGLVTTCGSGRLAVWRDSQICKRAQCKSPAAPENSELRCSDNIYQYQTVCEIQCTQGFLAVGPLFIMCMADGSWTKKATHCIKHEPEYTQCEPFACNGHSCIKSSLNDFVTCKCSHGWTGIQCEIPPTQCAGNICMHNSTCRSHKSNYSCTCRSGFSGVLCQISPVNGNWSDWSDWSKCSVTCGSGVRTRHRACNNPPPDIHGLICSGAYTEIIDCHTDKCKECPQLNAINTNLTSIECEVDNKTKLQTCLMYCKNGTVQTNWFKEFEQLKCGPETRYTWVPGNIFMSCLAPVVPERLLLDTELMYNSNIQKELQSEIEDTIMQNINETMCAQSSHCNITMTFLSSLAGADKKTQLILIFEWYLNYILPKTVNTSIVAVTEELKSAISDLRSTADYIKNFTKETFDIFSQNGVFRINDSSVRQNILVNCPKGHVNYNGICAECPPGTEVHNRKWLICQRGTFQQFTGQTLCLSCPHGHTTTSIGSTHVLECYAYKMVQIEKDDDSLLIGSIAAILGSVGSLIMAGVTTYTLYRKCKKNKAQEYSEMQENFTTHSRGHRLSRDREKIRNTKKYHIRVQSDERQCDIVSVCTLRDGKILLSDSKNKKLKCLDSTTYSVTYICVLPEKPWGVYSINEHKAAVCLHRQQEVHFISLSNKMKLSTKITTDFRCYDVAYADGKLYITDRHTSLYVYSVSGRRLKHFSKDQSGHNLFCNIRGLAVSDHGSTIYVADFDKGLIILDENGKFVGKHKSDQLNGAWDNYLTGKESLLVCGRYLNNVLKFGLDGELKGEVVQFDEFRYYRAICCNQQMSNIIISRECCDEIEVYDLQYSNYDISCDTIEVHSDNGTSVC